MIFKTELKVHQEILPKYPESAEFCCKDLEKSFLNCQISIMLHDNKLSCVLEKQNPNNVVINYCPFCGAEFNYVYDESMERL